MCRRADRRRLPRWSLVRRGDARIAGSDRRRAPARRSGRRRCGLPQVTCITHHPGVARHIRPMMMIMTDAILYKRVLPHGPAVRIRRTSDSGVTPVVAVLEVDRRAGTPREGIGTPPSLMQAEGGAEGEVLSQLEPHASDDRAMVLLIREHGLR